MAIKDRFMGNPGRLTVLTTSGSGCRIHRGARGDRPLPFEGIMVILRGMATCMESCLVGTVVHLWPEAEDLHSWSRLVEVGFVAAIKGCLWSGVAPLQNSSFQV
uniref:Uncharacterized protein n=1 Tax=Oryza sativa subsp. japonica TaxID=39947 RepID=Q5Z9R8_ORYSJ|nr:hypothetical protein [Oryza sativa Japonica Group]